MAADGGGGSGGGVEGTAAEKITEEERGEGSVESDGAARQLLGMKGAAGETNKWKIRLQLMKPVTWIPLIWGVTCGAAASGEYHWNNLEDVAKAVTCMFLAGPLLTGYTQVINDWYDREIDAINEPYRPIPSGLITEGDVKAQVAVLLTSGFLVSGALDYWAGHDWPVNVALTTFGVFIAYIYSAPPLKLKQNGWTGSYALGASYIALPWWAGQALFGALDWKTMVLTMFYSLAGLGIAIINDFKSVEGDRATGMQSLPVMFGIDTAKWITVGTIDVFQLLVAAILYAVDEKAYAAGIVALVLPQMYLQATSFLKDPVKVGGMAVSDTLLDFEQQHFYSSSDSASAESEMASDLSLISTFLFSLSPTERRQVSGISAALLGAWYFGRWSCPRSSRSAVKWQSGIVTLRPTRTCEEHAEPSVAISTVHTCYNTNAHTRRACGTWCGH